MIILGAVMAIAVGMGLPGHILLLGDIVNIFVYHSIATGISLPDNVTCTLEFLQQNPQILTQVAGPNTSNFGPYFCNSNSTDGQSSQLIFGNVLSYICDPGATVQEQIYIYSVYYIVLAVAVIITVFLATMLWNVSAYRQTRRIRQAFYRSVLRQEIGWFDVIDAAELSTMLAE